MLRRLCSAINRRDKPVTAQQYSPLFQCIPAFNRPGNLRYPRYPVRERSSSARNPAHHALLLLQLQQAPIYLDCTARFACSRVFAVGNKRLNRYFVVIYIRLADVLDGSGRPGPFISITRIRSYRLFEASTLCVNALSLRVLLEARYVSSMQHHAPS